MCDCYVHKCEHCDWMVPMHLEDFSTERDEIQVFCEDHLPENMTDGMVWEYNDNEKVKNPRKWHKVFVRWLTDNARIHAQGNSPNTWHCRRLDSPLLSTLEGDSDGS